MLRPASYFFSIVLVMQSDDAAVHCDWLKCYILCDALANTK